jgi:nicotinamide riboside kinase
MHKIVVSGPESTGKTDLSAHVAERLGISYVPEYARAYIETLDRPYRFEDVEHIARVQWDQYLEFSRKDAPAMILDTFLVITKIWFREVYGKIPEWIDQSLEQADIDLFLLCYPDLEWVADDVRENPGIRRMELFDSYHDEILRCNFSCAVIRGNGQDRYTNAITAIQSFLPQLKI